jgi:gamma-glutamyltranspeptidase/glutathione hydrolase
VVELSIFFLAPYDCSEVRMGPAGWPLYAVSSSVTEVVSDGGLVVGPDQEIADAGARVLAAGGNAVDAAVAAAFATGVVEPWSAGLGGSATITVALRDPDRVATVEGHLVSSRNVRPEQYPLAPEGQRGELIEVVFGMAPVVGQANLYGGTAVTTPGAVACLLTAQERYGRISRQQVLEPAVALAADGFVVNYLTSAYLLGVAAGLSRDPGCTALFLPDRLPLRGPGSSWPDRLVQPNLARTLELIGAKGAEVFYHGEIASSMVSVVREGGGVLDMDDLGSYAPTVVDPAFEAPFGSVSLVGAPDAGMPTLLEALYIYETLAPPTVGERAVAWARALIAAFEDRFKYITSDPSIAVPWDTLRSSAYAHARLAAVLANAEPPDPFAFDAAPPRAAAARPARGSSGHTSQCAAVDGDGNMASLTSTVLNAFGARVLDPATGIVLNGGMAYFDPQPGGMNSIRPGVKVLSAMTPLVLADPERGPYAALGASGGRRIISGVAQIVADLVLDGVSLQAAMEAPHIHAESETSVMLETQWPREAADALDAAGFRVVPIAEGPTTGNFARPNGVIIGPDGKRRSGIDPKKPVGIAVA